MEKIILQYLAELGYNKKPTTKLGLNPKPKLNQIRFSISGFVFGAVLKAVHSWEVQGYVVWEFRV